MGGGGSFKAHKFAAQLAAPLTCLQRLVLILHTPQTLTSKFLQFFLSALLSVLQTIYFSAEARDGMIPPIKLVYEWYQNRRAELESLPLSDVEKWQRKNEARLSAMESLRAKYLEGMEAPATRESLSRKSDDSLGSIVIDKTVYRPAIGRSPQVLRKHFRTTNDLANVKMNQVHDWDADQRMFKHFEPTKYKYKDLDASQKTRKENEDRAQEEIYFGEFGVFSENSKDQVESVVDRLFGASSSRKEGKSEAPEEENLATKSSADTKSDGKESKEGDDEENPTTPRDVVHDTQRLTAKFSTPEHMSAESWHRGTKDVLAKVVSSTNLMERLRSRSKSSTVTLFARSRNDLEARPDMLYGAEYSKSIRASAAASGKAAVEMLKGRRISSILAKEAFMESSPRDGLDDYSSEGIPPGDLLLEMGGELIVKRRAGDSEDESGGQSDSYDALNDDGRFEGDDVKLELEAKKHQRSNTEQEQENFELCLTKAIKGTTLHDFNSDDANSWLFQHEMLARRMPLTPRTQKDLAAAKIALEARRKPPKKKSNHHAAGKSAKKASGGQRGAGGGGGGKKPARKKKKKKEDQSQSQNQKTTYLNYSAQSYMNTKWPGCNSSSQSLLRLKQCSEIEEIQEKFKAAGMQAPDINVLNRALLTTQDKPTIITMWNLNSVLGDNLMKNPLTKHRKRYKKGTKAAAKKGKKKKVKKK